MLETLVHSRGPVSGEDLGAQLGVTSRTIRSYVRALNRRGALITSTHRGYVIDQAVHVQAGAAGQAATQTPEKRLQFLCLHLAQRPEAAAIHELADLLCVSESTLDADLARVRETLRRHDLLLRRDRCQVWTEGSERARRSVILDMSRDPHGGLIATWRTFCDEYAHFDVKTLREDVAARVEEFGLEMNEYSLTDLVMYLVIATDRVNLGRSLPAGRSRSSHDPRLVALSDRIGEVVEDRYALTLPPTELAALDGVLQARTIRRRESGPDLVLARELGAIVAELMDEVAHQYQLDRPDASLLRNLTLHVQNMVARARADSALPPPLGVEFKNDHPLAHDLAVCLAGKLEDRLGIDVEAGELDYLAFHLGAHYMSVWEERDLVSVTLVVPRFYDLEQRLADRLGEILRGQAVIVELVTSIGYDFSASTSDLIVSCMQPEGPAGAPVVVISPLVAPRDVEHLQAAVQRARRTRTRRRVREALGTLLDQRLFVRDDRVGSREEAIGVLCEALRRAGVVDGDYVRAVLEREQRSATSFGGEVAIPHAVGLQAARTRVAVLACDRGIPWGSERVRLVFLVALSPDERAVFRDLLEDLTGLLAPRGSVAAVVARSCEFDEFVAALVEQTEADPAAAVRPEQAVSEGRR